MLTIKPASSEATYRAWVGHTVTCTTCRAGVAWGHQGAYVVQEIVKAPAPEPDRIGPRRPQRRCPHLNAARTLAGVDDK